MQLLLEHSNGGFNGVKVLRSSVGVISIDSKSKFPVKDEVNVALEKVKDCLLAREKTLMGSTVDIQVLGLEQVYPPLPRRQTDPSTFEVMIMYSSNTDTVASRVVRNTYRFSVIEEL